MVKFADGGNKRKLLQYNNLPWLAGQESDVSRVSVSYEDFTDCNNFNKFL